jgi:hypothetical protein
MLVASAWKRIVLVCAYTLSAAAPPPAPLPLAVLEDAPAVVLEDPLAVVLEEALVVMPAEVLVVLPVLDGPLVLVEPPVPPVGPRVRLLAVHAPTATTASPAPPSSFPDLMRLIISCKKALSGTVHADARSRGPRAPVTLLPHPSLRR